MDIQAQWDVELGDQGGIEPEIDLAARWLRERGYDQARAGLEHYTTQRVPELSADERQTYIAIHLLRADEANEHAGLATYDRGALRDLEVGRHPLQAEADSGPVVMALEGANRSGVQAFVNLDRTAKDIWDQLPPGQRLEATARELLEDGHQPRDVQGVLQARLLELREDAIDWEPPQYGAARAVRAVLEDLDDPRADQVVGQPSLEEHRKLVAHQLDAIGGDTFTVRGRDKDGAELMWTLDKAATLDKLEQIRELHAKGWQFDLMLDGDKYSVRHGSVDALQKSGETLIYADAATGAAVVARDGAARLVESFESARAVHQALSTEKGWNLSDKDLDIRTARRFLEDGYSASSVSEGVAAVSPAAARSKDPAAYALGVLDKALRREPTEVAGVAITRAQDGPPLAADRFVADRQALIERGWGMTDAAMDERVTKALLQDGFKPLELAHAIEAHSPAAARHDDPAGYSRQILRANGHDLGEPEVITLEDRYLAQRSSYVQSVERRGGTATDAFVDERVAGALLKDGHNPTAVAQVLAKHSPAALRHEDAAAYSAQVLASQGHQLEGSAPKQRSLEDQYLEQRQAVEQLYARKGWPTTDRRLDSAASKTLLEDGHAPADVAAVLEAHSPVAARLGSGQYGTQVIRKLGYATEYASTDQVSEEDQGFRTPASLQARRDELALAVFDRTDLRRSQLEHTIQLASETDDQIILKARNQHHADSPSFATARQVIEEYSGKRVTPYLAVPDRDHDAQAAKVTFRAVYDHASSNLSTNERLVAASKAALREGGDDLRTVVHDLVVNELPQTMRADAKQDHARVIGWVARGEASSSLLTEPQMSPDAESGLQR